VSELVVRMGEIAATQHAGDVLVGLGLGSCIGLVIVDDRGPVAAMAHVVLPESNGNGAGVLMIVASYSLMTGENGPSVVMPTTRK